MNSIDKDTNQLNSNATNTHLKDLLQRNAFINIVEMVTTRGLITDQAGSKVMKLANDLVNNPNIHCLSITDNPGGNPNFGADVLGVELKNQNQEVIIHLSCKDWNRNALESRAWQLASMGFNNILALSGDYPISGHRGQAQPVFDIDSVGLLQLLSEMNNGITHGKKTLSSTNFFLGAAITNHKKLESEVMPQYFKLKKKIENGANFFICQIGWDSRKQDELLKYMKLYKLNQPTIANIYVLSRAVARFFSTGKIPGVIVLPELLELCEKHGKSQDKGKGFFLEFAAKQVAIARGLGFQGTYLGGLNYSSDINKLLEIADSFSNDDWHQFTKEICFHYPDEFYYFSEGSVPGTSSNKINLQYSSDRLPKSMKSHRRKVSKAYKISRWIHSKIFKKGTFGYSILKKIAKRIEMSPSYQKKLFHTLEHNVKSVLYDCKDCGDCSLPEIAYLCPESQCVKNQRNGPCGGTREGKCEIGEKDCIWSRAYERLKAYGEESEMLSNPVVIKNGSLKGTSAWINTYLERDHFDHNS